MYDYAIGEQWSSLCAGQHQRSHDNVCMEMCVLYTVYTVQVVVVDNNGWLLNNNNNIVICQVCMHTHKQQYLEPCQFLIIQNIFLHSAITGEVDNKGFLTFFNTPTTTPA